MATVRIPTPLRGLTDGEATVACPGATVGDVLRALDREHPGVASRIIDDAGMLQRFVNVFVGEQDVRELAGLESAVVDADVLSIVPAVAGGAAGRDGALGDDIGVGSFLAHGGGRHDPVTGAVVPGIPVATTFARDDAYALTSDDHMYVRDHDDAVRRVEAVVQQLEGAAATRVFASGMAAITAVVRSLRPGQTMVLQTAIYWAATATLRRLCEHHGIKLVEVDCVDMLAAEAIIAAERPALVLVEALSNPMMGVVDIPALAAATHAVGGTLVVDATVATPLSLPALSLGADLVLHSATKSMNGHSDVLAGVVSCADADSERWAFIVAERAQAGAVLGPFGAWLLLRGLRTFALRHDRACQSAQRLAEVALAHPGAVAVLYPGLPSHPGHELAAGQLTRGFGGLLSVRTAGGREGALRAAGALQLMVRATSLGGVETLVEHRFSVEQGVTDVPQDLLRISVGIEEIDDLVADLRRALDAAVG